MTKNDELLALVALHGLGFYSVWLESQYSSPWLGKLISSVEYWEYMPSLNRWALFRGCAVQAQPNFRVAKRWLACGMHLPPCHDS